MTRQELYDLIWSEPARTIAPRFGISDVALSKLCEKHEIPQPPRGYWAKREAGKSVPKFPLSPRGLGISDTVTVGRHVHWSYGTPIDLIRADLGPAPAFAETLDAVTERVRKLVGKVTVSRDLSRAHHNVQTLLRDDDKRRTVWLSKSYRSSFDAPLFDSPFDKRRLRMMNGLMLALARLGCKPTLSRKKDPEQIDYKVGHMSLALKVDEPGYSRSGWRSDRDMAKAASTGMKVSIMPRPDSIQAEWQDKGDYKIEDHVAEIVVMALVAGEAAYRQQEVCHYHWLVERKAQLIEEGRKATVERERKERERLEAERKARIDGLLSAAARHRQANDIRDYVASVRSAKVAVTEDQLERWAAWALRQADDLDPLVEFSVDVDGTHNA